MKEHSIPLPMLFTSGENIVSASWISETGTIDLEIDLETMRGYYDEHEGYRDPGYSTYSTYLDLSGDLGWKNLNSNWSFRDNRRTVW